MTNEVSRRRLLGVAGAVAVAGCLDAGDSKETNGEGQIEPTNEPSIDESETANDSTATEANAAETVHEDYETTEVRAVTADGDELGTVTAAIADTSDLRYLGLSDTEELPPDRGMLFVYESVEERTFVMREMDFGIDIVYADADGSITDIHHAPAPGPNEDGNDQRYPGRGRYVLEANYEWTTEHDVSEGDILEFDLEESVEREE
ncbi:protein of unknown function DUF192 [Haloterrigena turkmenica DSM 5511]|uniref:DUF192 domain-containing protein n=1 Tax=Haloterrigena turkmenica (strain ATCC 51198 / DSM 5511 / JCM 9101 / NCIMB 13204 / VKM B-1734 / 4k) TaxID=543526 RepID=D2RRA4_HALTV|nr:DUF192 domain-containing protein [Haloterrigena turkmenica]ADB62500.1 protein of unknown function DUF192 [Haloterrigena turkmenica DSM 5511]